MAWKKYQFDPDQLSLSPVKRSLKKWLIRASSFVLLSLCIGVAGFFLSSGIVQTHREKNLITQNQRLLDLFASLDERLDAYDRTLSSMVMLDDSIYRSLVGTEPLPWSLREAGVGGNNRNLSLREAGFPEQVVRTAERIDRLDYHLKIQENSYREVLRDAFRKRARLNHLPAIMPISNEDLKLTGAGFGIRLHPILNIYRMHEGIDFFSSTGTPVFATADGVVRDVRTSGTFGKVIELDHGYGIVTLYAHLNRFKAKEGQLIKRGDTIGEVGNTGLSSGQHLHYEVHINGNEVDPVNYFFKDLSPEEYRKIVAIAQAFEKSMD